MFCIQDLPNYTGHTTDTTAAELFVNCLEAMVETCLPVEEGDQQIAQYPSMLSVSSNMNLSSSLSSLTLGSPTDKGKSIRLIAVRCIENRSSFLFCGSGVYMLFEIASSLYSILRVPLLGRKFLK